MSSPKPVYAPLPARAMVDPRLSERHLRTLAVVAAHDRLGKNGIGCWASHQRLAAMVGCHYTRISHNLKELGALGYIEQVEHPLNKRLRVYRVLYTDEDGRAMKAAATDSCPNGQVSDDTIVAQSDNPDGGIVAQSGKSPAGIVAHQNQEVADSVEEFLVNIFPEGGKRLGEAFEIDSAEAAPLGSGAPSSLNIGGVLAQFERALKEGRLPGKETLQHWHDWLEELHDSLDINDPNSGRAYRLLEEVDWPEEVYADSTERNLAGVDGGHDEAPDPTVTTSGTAQGAMKGATGKAPASWAGTVLDEEWSLAQMFPKLYDTFLPNDDHPWDPTPGDADVLERLIHASRDERAQASVLLKRKGPDAGAAWVRANLAARASAA